MNKVIVELNRFAKWANLDKSLVTEYIKFNPVKSRSSQQLRLYWGVWLPVIFANLPEKLCDINTIEKLHYALKFSYCYYVKPELFSKVIIKNVNGSWGYGFIPFSLELNELAVDDANDYFNYIPQWVNKNIGCFIDDLIDNQ
jgi:hypothetical protein